MTITTTAGAVLAADWAYCQDCPSMSAWKTSHTRMAVALLAALISASAPAGQAKAGEPTWRSCPAPYKEGAPLKMITRGVSCEAAEQIVLKVNALVLSEKPLHPIAGFHCQVIFKSGRPIQCHRGEQSVRSPIPDFP